MEEGQFKGQDRLSLVAELLSGQARQQVHVLAGLGGSGKSRLALEVADRAQRAGHRVWWVSMPELSLRMRMMAHDLGAPSITVERAWLLGSAMDLVWKLLNDCPDPWLLIFDNADDPARLGPRDGLVSDGTGWLRKPQNANGTVLVTSRVGNRQKWGDWVGVHKVLPLHEDDGASLLLERTGGWAARTRTPAGCRGSWADSRSPCGTPPTRSRPSTTFPWTARSGTSRPSAGPSRRGWRPPRTAPGPSSASCWDGRSWTRSAG